MTNETKRRIEYLKESLPVMQQKLMAAISMLIISLLITVTASYAWVSISVNPEARGMDTTISGNGSLEIALVSDDGSEPAKSAKGDSTASGNRLTAANETWGNLINLTDDSYGLSELILRPALLNTVNLKLRPLQGAVYGTDGRISGTSDKYMYTTWDEKGKQFVVPRENNEYIDDFGVRAIASFKYTTAAATNATYDALVTEAGLAHSEAEIAYRNATDDKKIQALQGLMQAYVQSYLNSGNDVDVTEYLGSMYDMYSCLYESMQAQQEVFIKLANIQLFVDATNNNKAYNSVTWNELYKNRNIYDKSKTGNSNQIISLTGLAQFCSDLDLVEKDLSHLKTYYESSQADSTKHYYFSSGGTSGYNITNMVNRLINTGTVTINDMAINTISTDNIGELLGMLGGDNVIVIQNGILCRYEQLAIDNYRLDVEEISISVKYGIFGATISGSVSTAASGSSYYSYDYSRAQVDSLSGSDPVAEDTYGLAVDMWLRSNEDNTTVLLEGAVVTDATGTVIGYDGVNRVWNTTNDSMLSTNSTTQGSGSCYVFQADTPEDQARSLELLDCFKIAFIGSDGEYYASASMDTDNYYAKNGEVTVPIVVDANANIYEEDVDGKTVRRYGIINLEKNEATWITALVYLDGSKITNEEVLINGELEGSLNIQFGSSANLVTKGSDVLESETRTVNAWASKSKGGERYKDIILDRTEDKKAYISLDILDDNAKDITTVTGSFMRVINSVQGTKQEEITFTKDSDGSWTGESTFALPGKYVLQSVKINGLVCNLDQSCSVEVKGYEVASIDWSETGTEPVIVTTDKTHKTDINMVVSALNMDNKQPDTATARFLDEFGNSVNVVMTYEKSSGRWKGTANFVSSGVYTLQYVLLDGEYYSVPETLKLTLNLGISFRVQTDGSPTTIQYQEADEDGNPVENKYPTNLKLNVYNDAGQKLSDLGYEMTLYYAYNGSKLENTGMPLKWDETLNYYTTSFVIDKIGTYTFHSLELKDSSGNVSTLTNAEYAQSFSLYPPATPVYFSWEGRTWFVDDEKEIYEWRDDNTSGVRDQFTFGSSAKVTIYLKNASASDAKATFSYEGSDATITTDFVSAGEPINVSRKIGVSTYYDEDSGEIITEELFEKDTYAPFTFEVPETIAQEGTWKLESIELCNVFFDGELHTGTDPKELYHLDVSEEGISGSYSSKITANLEIVDSVDSDGFVNFGGNLKDSFVGTHKLTFNQDVGNVETITIEYSYSYDSAYITGVKKVESFEAKQDSLVAPPITNPKKETDGSYLIKLPLTKPGEYTFKSLTLIIAGKTYVTEDLETFTEGDAESKFLSVSNNAKAAKYALSWNVVAPTLTINTANMEVDGQTPNIQNNAVVMTGYYGYEHSITGMTVNVENASGSAPVETIRMTYNKAYDFTSQDKVNFTAADFSLQHGADCKGITIYTENNLVTYVYSDKNISIDVVNSAGDTVTMTLKDSNLLDSMPSFAEHVVAPTIEYNVSGVVDKISATNYVGTEGNDVVLGKDASGNKVSLFMDEHKITSGINLTVRDNFGNATISGSKVSITYHNDGSQMEAYGGYTTTDSGAKNVDAAVVMKSSGVNKNYGLSEDCSLSLRTAGRYSLNKVEVTLNEVTYTYDSGGVSYTLPDGAKATVEDAKSKASKAVVVNGGIQVHSATPYMEWTDVSDKDTQIFSFKDGFGTEYKISGETSVTDHKYDYTIRKNSIDTKNATVSYSVKAYIQEKEWSFIVTKYTYTETKSITDGGGYYFKSDSDITAPSLTATIYQLGKNYTNAAISFTGDGSGSGSSGKSNKDNKKVTVTFNFTPSAETNKQSVGYRDGNYNYGLGTNVTSDTLNATYSGVEYTFKINKMTINHQY